VCPCAPVVRAERAPSLQDRWLLRGDPRISEQDFPGQVVKTEESESAVYAVVRAGSKQQKVAVGDVIEIDKVETGVGESLTLPVVMVVDGETVTATGLDKAGVTVEVLGATKGPKIVIQKYKNKTGYKKRQGHRQKYTQVKVTDITV
jgi:large subunit ribosomal protein L21